MRTLLVAVVALVAAFPPVHAAEGGGVAAPATGVAASWREALHVDSRRADPDKPFEAFDAASLNLFDFDGDGRLEIVSHNDNNRAYVLDGDDGDVLAEIGTTHPGGEAWGARDINAISIGDLRGDGTPCMVIPNSASYLSAWCYDGRRMMGGFRFDQEWEIRVDAAHHEPGFARLHPWIAEGAQPGMDGNAYLADVDDDGTPEIFVETDGYPGQLAFEHDGAYRWSTSYWDGNGGAVVRDLDGDGRKEAVFSSDAGVIACYDAATGALEWTFEAAKNGASPGSVPVTPLVADLDGDGRDEIFFAARNVADPASPGWIERSHAVWFALRHDGALLWRVSDPWMNPLSYTHPAAVDVDGDGALDVLALDWNTVGHKPGNWETTGRPSNLFALDGRTGRTLWRADVPVYWSNKDFAILDLPGSDGPEVVLNAHKHGVDGLTVRALADGREVGWYPVSSEWNLMRGPVAGDLDGDGRVELVVPVARDNPEPNYRDLDVGHREGALKVIETGARGEPVFSANFLHAESTLVVQRSAFARIASVATPWLGVLLGTAALAGGALFVMRGRRWG